MCVWPAGYFDGSGPGVQVNVGTQHDASQKHSKKYWASVAIPCRRSSMLSEREVTMSCGDPCEPYTQHAGRKPSEANFRTEQELVVNLLRDVPATSGGLPDFVLHAALLDAGACAEVPKRRSTSKARVLGPHLCHRGMHACVRHGTRCQTAHVLCNVSYSAMHYPGPTHHYVIRISIAWRTCCQYASSGWCVQYTASSLQRYHTIQSVGVGLGTTQIGFRKQLLLSRCPWTSPEMYRDTPLQEGQRGSLQ